MSQKNIAEVLNQFSRSSMFLEFPNSQFGTVKLDIWENFIQSHPNGQRSDAQCTEAEELFLKSRSLYHPSNPQPSIDVMLTITHRFPLWGKGHIAMFDVMHHLGKLEEASYHLAQYIILFPEADRIAHLGKLMGRLGHLEESEIILMHLILRADKGVVKDILRTTVFDLLVTLGRLQKGESMVMIARWAMNRWGFEPSYAYQEILGLLIQKETQKAKQYFLITFPRIPAQHPMYAKFLSMKNILKL